MHVCYLLFCSLFRVIFPENARHIDVMKKTDSDKEQRFTSLIDTYNTLVAKVCYIYSGPGADFDDLYQEVLVNLWQGFDSFRGESRVSTWIYRAAINTCITWHRRNARRHVNDSVPLEFAGLVAEDDNSEEAEQRRQLYEMIASLQPLDKAIVTLWLDENSYDDIAEITGLSRANVATRLHRIKQYLIKNTEL